MDPGDNGCRLKCCSHPVPYPHYCSISSPSIEVSSGFPLAQTPTANVIFFLQRKLQLIGLFSLGFLVVIITLIRLPIVVIKSTNSQFTRTLWTSIEVLASTIVANAPLTKGILSGKMVQRKNISTNSGSGSGSSGLRSARAGVTIGGSNDLGAVESNSGDDIRMTAYGAKRRKDSLDDSDEEALNPVGSSNTANNSVRLPQE